MGFFDLNIPYTESTKRNSTTDKATRLKLAVKAMELGYTGVAYNRTITGVMSEVDRCSIHLFPLSSVLKLSPSISASVNLRRGLLNVPITAPFRQYTRLTVVVDTPAQGSCLNSGNPILKTYDIVAVRPLKQESFDLACKNYEVDIIAIDFSENRFRLKQPLIKAAIERGVFFEITYSGLLSDAHFRRQTISNVKLLVDWTRGKNVIFSSAAASVTELRGPYDAANLACLLGFSTERAKASVSKTCRLLLESSLRKKKFFKEAIRVELVSSKDDGFDDWLKWDPISSGDGDLQLDDMAKSFAASNKESKTVKAIDFVSIINELPSHGLQISDMITATNRDSKPNDAPEKDHFLKFGNSDISLANENPETMVSDEAGEFCDMIIEEPELQNLPVEVHEDTHEEIVIDKKECANNCSDVPNVRALISVDDDPSNLQSEETNNFSPNASTFPPMPADRMLPFSDACLPEEVLEEHTPDTKDVSAPVSPSLVLSTVSLNEDIPEEHTNVTGENVSSSPSPSEALSTLRSQDGLQINDCNPVVHEPVGDVSMEVNEEVKDDYPPSDVLKSQDELQINGCNSVVHELVGDVSMEVNAEIKDDDPPFDVLPTLRSEEELQINGCNSVVHEPVGDDVSMEVHAEVKDDSHMNHLTAQDSLAERGRRKHGGARRSLSFPFKRMLKPSHFKKRLKFKRKAKIL